jgi:hypothetical protein
MKEEKPNKKQIEKYREEKDENLTEEDLIVMKSLSYMNKYKEYMKNIKKIEELKFLPTESEKYVILENFQKYLVHYFLLKIKK